MTAATTSAARTWADAGTRLLLDAVDTLDDAALDLPCALPGWSRRHLLAHVASNAEALGRLLDWARTGVENPMYASAEQRAAEIESGALRPDLRERVRDTAQRLAVAMDAMPALAWTAPVVTAQGRTVRAAETIWLRARETCIHAVDLDAGVRFTDLPADFLVALIEDVVTWRSSRTGPPVVLRTPRTLHELPGKGDRQKVELPVAMAAAWLVGRGPARPDLPELPRWL
ncbi:maleylpyruvate isomerase family mycothiol-dependent enzyme [Pseudonocardia sp. NPDC049635]|uniref:maleylpyruvate isomerase family mycothiol-dependent enzyme n=1 Tax=Pseudonocardia sp. NPDC049635 TaxID=3155506 RepID=UPI0033FC9B78